MDTPSVLAEDDPFFRSLFEVWLGGGGFAVRFASDGIERSRRSPRKAFPTPSCWT